MDCLFITDKPEITAHPQSVAKTEGDNLTLSCNDTANPIATISWTRNRSPVDTSHNSSRIRFSADKKQLTITNVNRTDSGEYRCVASNELGNDTSNAAKLDIQCELSVSFQCGNFKVRASKVWCVSWIMKCILCPNKLFMKVFRNSRERRVVFAVCLRYFSS